ncbi:MULTISPECIES: hypothetical protein [unclassified Roseofilum]|uniref:hypothetical protein n=1 Tax=unclassified Roseofilum TaxID=2620099 RepID=UPI000E7E850D|nr:MULTISPECIES: hypothetical protein [unclassified Roseofilum]MBP0008390.1 hypothetical protein [Roseofilum sp. Belize Diploria]MBP0035593.1 hypothetical protein [Roseofilum sp. Belize BBD 4]HBR00185.1 hypothetical protein [Cyanobacteria bacterium UBA11691]
MKTVIKVASLFACTLLCYANFSLPVFTSKIAPTSSIAQAQSTEQQLTVALPEVAQIALKDGTTLSGRAIDINPQSITLERSNQSRKIDWETVSSVQFDRDSDTWLTPGRRLVIRGEEGEEEKKPLILDIPANQIQKLDPDIGHFRLDLSFLSRGRIRGILQVASDHLYVVEQIEYNQSQNVFTLQAKPYLSQ